MAAQNLNDFYSSLQEQLVCAEDVVEAGWTKEDYLTNIMLDYLEEAGEVTDPIMCPFYADQVQLSAYAVSEDYDSVSLFTALYRKSEKPKNVTPKMIKETMRKMVELYHRATNGLHEFFEKDSDTYGFARTLYDHKNTIKTLSVCVLTNGLVKKPELPSFSLENMAVTSSVWDLDRLYRCVISGKARETIEIDFQQQYGQLVPCLEASCSDQYQVYLAFLPGDLLASMYRDHRDRLLERNVRSYLQARGKVNKGIRDTLREEPDMFLAYNNGISATAETVDVVQDKTGKTFLRHIRDLQIVNGGQTTVSVFNASKGKPQPCDLSRVFVQMKLSVIPDPVDMNDMVPRISRFANTQNRIQDADFTSHAPYIRRLEELSRTIYFQPPGSGESLRWYFERARGQYAGELTALGTKKQKDEFKATNILFSKTDMAKYENSWDQFPWLVSLGSQKNFSHFMARVEERGKSFLPDEALFRALVTKAILFRRTEKLVQDQKFGGYRANIVTYTIAWLSHHTEQRLDLTRIWKEQALTPELEEQIVIVSKAVHSMITDPPDGANITEWCKKEACWKSVCALELPILEELRQQLLKAPSHAGTRKQAPVGLDSLTPEEQKRINDVTAVSGKTWFSLANWAKQTQNFSPYARRVLYSVGKAINMNKNPTIKQANYVWPLYNEALEKGFTPEGDG